MLMQNFGVINKEHYGMFWYFLEWLITLMSLIAFLNVTEETIIPDAGHIIVERWLVSRPW